MIRGFGAGIPLLNAMKGVTSAVRSWWNLPRWLDVYWKEMMWESRESPFKKIDDWCLVRRIMLESVHVSFLVSEIETFRSKPWNWKDWSIELFQIFSAQHLSKDEDARKFSPCTLSAPSLQKYLQPGDTGQLTIKINHFQLPEDIFHQVTLQEVLLASPAPTYPCLPVVNVKAWWPDKTANSVSCFFVILFEGEPDGLCWNWRVLLVSFVNAWRLSSQILVCTAASDSTSTRLMYLVISYKGLSSGLLVCCILDGSVTRRKSTTFANSHSSIHLYTIDSCILPQ